MPSRGICACKQNMIEKGNKECDFQDMLDEFINGALNLSFYSSTLSLIIVSIFVNPVLLFQFVEFN